MKERIKQVRTSCKMSMREFGERVGISASSIARIESGEYSPSEQTIRAICQQFRVSRAWLVDGLGEMEVVPESTEELIDEKLANGSEFSRALLRVISKMSDDDLRIVEKLFESLRAEVDGK